ncbi:peptidase S8 [Bacillus canaveralius]|uniref:Peptidase S8 n=1 Tax=Bacillus canaveralius TaxID=1403243 RepID=A0A2N5GG63_9BACI|nr:MULTISPECIES: S8 family serine peptidase [Bacillus]PLR79723.1 peptidase S8 [Bacillus canaveralius]PLR87098.1 peptidase S8 [Bacillus sp. V33-4]PLR94952.1 peptidase S8 [Bacillus canaveralius]RSK50690.1 peptidase S8 [Bacillus canaveralius]
MKKRRILGAAVLSLAMGFSMFSSAAFGQATEKAESQQSYRVLIHAPAVQTAQVKQMKDKHGARWDFGSEGFTTTVNAQQYQALQKIKNLKVELVPEVEIQATAPIKAAATVPSDQTPWGIQAIYNDSAIQRTSGGNGIKVAVLDTGVNRNHIDLVQNVEQCKDFTQTSPLVNGSCTDRNGHGTHVAGTALANGGSDGLGIYGVAPEAELWAYKVLTDSGSGYSDDIAGAIRHVADEAARTGSKAVINMSLGSSAKDTLISNAVDYAYSKGVLVVAAAGNSGPNSNTIGYPGALVNAVAVAALENVQQNGTYRVANFSSRGNPNTDGDYVIQERDVEISSPGSAIESTWYDGNYNTISGTSMATPHVAGLAAKIWSASPTLSHVQLRAQLQNRAKQYDIKGGTGAATGDDYASGFGFARVK